MAFEGKVILITGGNSGIGAACAVHFTKEGAQLALVGRNESKFEKVTEIIAASGVETEPLIIIADVSIDFERIMCETIEKYGRLDILINNAGFSIPGTIEDIKIENFDAMFATNVRGLMLLTQLAIPHLVESKGNIINISSVAGIKAFPNYLGYCMSKAALDQFTRCIALDLADKGVRVNVVNPGFIETDFHTAAGISEEVYPAVLETMAKIHPIGRTGITNDVVNAIAFLANENSSFLTGVSLPVDGALSIKTPF